MMRPLTSGIAGPAAEPMPTAWRPDTFTGACRWTVATYDRETAHRMLDQVVTSLLCSLGYGEGMGVFLMAAGEMHTADPS